MNGNVQGRGEAGTVGVAGGPDATLVLRDGALRETGSVRKIVLGKAFLQPSRPNTPAYLNRSQECHR